MDLTVGQKRKFVFTDVEYVIHEILDTPEVQMVWEWDTGCCPHCKRKITRKANHKFIKIEILLPEGVNIEEATRESVLVFGNTIDNKNMIISKDKYNEVFTKSQLFSNLVMEE